MSRRIIFWSISLTTTETQTSLIHVVPFVAVHITQKSWYCQDIWLAPSDQAIMYYPGINIISPIVRSSTAKLIVNQWFLFKKTLSKLLGNWSITDDIYYNAHTCQFCIFLVHTVTRHFHARSNLSGMDDYQLIFRNILSIGYIVTLITVEHDS